MPCMLSDISVEIQGDLEDVRTSLAVTRINAVVAGFTVDGARLIPSPDRSCTLSIALSDDGELRGIDLGTSVRFLIEPMFWGDTVDGIDSLVYCLGNDGQYRWFITCPGTPHCTDCSIEEQREFDWGAA